MRFATALAAMAALLISLPAAAQKAPEKAEPLKAEVVRAEAVKKLPAILTEPDPENTWLLDLSSGGRVTIRLRPDAAPQMVERIKTLTRRHFYDGLLFFRVNDAPEGMAQGGDPNNNGTGESDLPDLPAEFNKLPHLRGVVSAARHGAPENATPEQIKAAHDSANSQFFVMLTPKLAFDENYTVFGRVTEGMQWIDAMERGEPPANPTKILRAWIAADNPPPYQPTAPDLPVGETEVVLPGAAPPGP